MTNRFAELLGALALPLSAAQGLLMLVDEWSFHRVRRLGRWESWGHVADSAVFAAALAPAALLAPTRGAAVLYAAGAAVSAALVTKDEWIHARECEPTEHWVHALLFALHPCVLICVGALWAAGEGALLRAALPLVVLGYSFYQWLYWLGGRRFRAEDGPRVDNEFYDGLGKRWHEGDVHAIALLRAETPMRLEYVLSALEKSGVKPGARVLDVGCGGGLLANPLAAAGFRVKGVDRSAPSLEAARARVPAGADAVYAVGDALKLGETPGSYDAVLLMDVLEHLEEPARAVAEAARALKPGGLLLFHTFNRTPEAWLVGVKGIGFVAREGPGNVHSYELFITPEELAGAGRACGLVPRDLRGIRPVLNGAFAWSLLNRRVHPNFAFTLTRSTRVGYLGCLVKPVENC
jgi:2-polyprenyl-6-hydroxyphenyl methylase/3-demethylubiquinone-9 3-methyltransferase